MGHYWIYILCNIPIYEWAISAKITEVRFQFSVIQLFAVFLNTL
jgi:hypothetical protein